MLLFRDTDVLLNEGKNKLTRRKHFLQQKIILTVWEMPLCRKCKYYSQSFICFIFVLWRVKVEVEVIGQSMGKCTWCRVSYFFFRFKNVHRIAGIFWFIMINSIKFRYCLIFHILFFKYFEECFGEFFALQLQTLTQSLAPFACLSLACKFSIIG